MSNSDDRYRKHLDGQVAIVVPGTTERGRRCQNCSHWDNSDNARDYYTQRRLIDLQNEAKRILEEAGLDLSNVAPRRLGDLDPHLKQLGSNITLGDQYLAQGVVGVCGKGKSEGDFVHAFFLCEAWDQKFKPDGADEKPDLLPHEARIEAGLDEE